MLVSKHPSYHRWADIKARCTSPSHWAYSYYGGRGIRMYEPWLNSSRAFLEYLDEHLGPCPPGYSLDRVDNDRGYEPGNLRWADKHTQRVNQRNGGKRPTLRGCRRPSMVHPVPPFAGWVSTNVLADFYGRAQASIWARLNRNGWRGSSLGGLTPRKGNT